MQADGPKVTHFLVVGATITATIINILDLLLVLQHLNRLFEGLVFPSELTYLLSQSHIGLEILVRFILPIHIIFFIFLSRTTISIRVTHSAQRVKETDLFLRRLGSNLLPGATTVLRNAFLGGLQRVMPLKHC